MHVVATAGHVDHGKSTLVRALTGMEPDRFEEERRRGLTIELGYAWTTLNGGEDTIAFVDVPGHERFFATMLAGLGPAPAVMFVVAADEGWRQQSTEHLAAVDALGLSHGLLVVTRSDLADPRPATEQALGEIATTTLGEVPAVGVSARTGKGLAELRPALGRLVRDLPPPRRDGRIRFWVDRSFTIRGAGTVVTGTLGSGTLTAGDELQLGDRRLRIRGLESLGQPQSDVAAAGAVVLDADPPEFRRRGAAAARADWLAQAESSDPAAALAEQLRRRGAARRSELVALGIPVGDVSQVQVVGDWLVDPAAWQSWQDQLRAPGDERAGGR